MGPGAQRCQPRRPHVRRPDACIYANSTSRRCAPQCRAHAAALKRGAHGGARRLPIAPALLVLPLPRLHLLHQHRSAVARGLVLLLEQAQLALHLVDGRAVRLHIARALGHQHSCGAMGGVPLPFGGLQLPVLLGQRPGHLAHLQVLLLHLLPQLLQLRLRDPQRPLQLHCLRLGLPRLIAEPRFLRPQRADPLLFVDHLLPQCLDLFFELLHVPRRVFQLSHLAAQHRQLLHLHHFVDLTPGCQLPALPQFLAQLIRLRHGALALCIHVLEALLRLLQGGLHLLNGLLGGLLELHPPLLGTGLQLPKRCLQLLDSGCGLMKTSGLRLGLCLESLQLRFPRIGIRFGLAQLRLQRGHLHLLPPQRRPRLI
mmetsp:Transcript_51948/g.86559  ORF Transcript_51948/g.86559 Transcript_51948/m.86559 type:complete len:370 (-) Transcript_51948:3895-5004(-)